MIRFGLRLALRGGREAAVRLVITAAGVALAAGLLLITLAGVNAVNAQNSRYAWLGTGSSAASRARSGAAAGPAAEPLWWRLGADYFGGQVIGRVDVAATGPGSPVPPGIPRLPGPGQFYASPAFSRLLRATPAAQLGDRFPGREAGLIGASALPAPNSLIIITGHAASQLARVPGAVRVTSIQAVPGGCNGIDCLVGVGVDANGIALILAVVASALLLPVLVFISSATRLSAARREQRFAAMRLVGATPRQVSVISAVESTVAAAAGTAAGFGLFFLLRAPVAAVPFTGAPFFPGDLALSPADILLVAIGVPAAAAAGARLALRRVRISPLGVSRRVTPRAPRARRLIPLLAGVAELAFFAAISQHPRAAGGQLVVYLPGFLLIMAGLVIAGPWLAMAGARVTARRTSRPAVLIAARRLADNPGAGFRAISGLILALFVTSVAVGVITTSDADHGLASSGAAATDTAAADTLAEQFAGPAPGTPGTVRVPGAILAELRSIRGVRGVTVIHANPLGLEIPSATAGLPSSFGAVAAGLVSCAQLSRIPALGRCPAGAAAAAIPSQVLVGGRTSSSSQASVVWPAAAISAGRLERLPVQSLVVGTNGSAPSIDQARTVLEVAYPYRGSPGTIAEIRAGANSALAGWQQLADVVILTSLPIAGCALAVGVAGGLSDRRRPFSLLRLTGVPLRVLRRVILLESAVPLMVTAVVSVGAGLLTAQLFVSSQLGYSLRPPGAGYYLVVLSGLAASLGIIASAFPLLKRITGPETARND